jgi:hypothetical protein
VEKPVEIVEKFWFSTGISGFCQFDAGEKQGRFPQPAGEETKK